LRSAWIKTRPNYVSAFAAVVLRRTPDVYPERLAIIHGDQRRTWRSLRALPPARLALQRRGVGPGDTVAIIAPNRTAFRGSLWHSHDRRCDQRAQYALDPASVAVMLRHGEAKVLLTTESCRNGQQACN